MGCTKADFCRTSVIGYKQTDMAKPTHAGTVMPRGDFALYADMAAHIPLMNFHRFIPRSSSLLVITTR